MLMQVLIVVGAVLVIIVFRMIQDWSGTNEFWDIDVTIRKAFNRGGKLLEFVWALLEKS
jgi:NADH:ubiquinone oxidoreductase subunit 6 (subunit J)